MSVHQCETCQLWQLRGGALAAPTWQCMALEDEAGGPRTQAILIRTARLMASRNQCPTYSPFPNYPDAYRAQDLVR